MRKYSFSVKRNSLNKNRGDYERGYQILACPTNTYFILSVYKYSVPKDLGVFYNTSQFLQYAARGSDILPQPHTVGIID